MSDETRTLGEFRKNRSEVVRVTLGKFKAYDMLGVRAWAEKEGGTAIPMRNGLSLRVAQIPAMIEALPAAEKQARADGVL